jgi:hypothetical protein
MNFRYIHFAIVKVCKIVTQSEIVNTFPTHKNYGMVIWYVFKISSSITHVVFAPF